MALMAHWPLDGRLDDISGNGYDLVNKDCIVSDNGKIGKCYEFNGSSCLFNSDVFRITRNFSVSVWFNCDIGIGNSIKGLFYLGQDTDIKNQVFNISVIDSRVHFSSLLGVPSYQIYVCNFERGVWNHLVVVKKNKTVSFYLNNVKVYVLKMTWSIPSHIIYKLSIGRVSYNSQSDRFFAGKMNDIRVFNHALREYEIYDLNKLKILHWSFNKNEEYIENRASGVHLGFGGSRFSKTQEYPTVNFKVFGDVYRRTSQNSYYCHIHEIMTVDERMNPKKNDKYTVSFRYFKESECEVKSVRVGLLGKYEGESGGYAAVSKTSIIYGKPDVNNEWTEITFLVEYIPEIEVQEVTYINANMSGYENVQNLPGKQLYISNFKVTKKGYHTDYVEDVSGGIISDTSGFLNHGIVNQVNTPKHSTNSKVGIGCYEITDSDYTRPLSAITTNDNFVLPRDSFTICGWFRANDGVNRSKDKCMFSQSNTNRPNLPTNDTPSWGVFAGYGIDSGYVRASNGTFEVLDNGRRYSYVRDLWEHVAFVYNRDDDSVKLYVNGNMVDDTHVPRFLECINGYPLVLGNINSGNVPWNGYVDDFRVYASSLNKEQISEIMRVRVRVHADGVITAHHFSLEVFDHVDKIKELYPDAKDGIYKIKTNSGIQDIYCIIDDSKYSGGTGKSWYVVSEQNLNVEDLNTQIGDDGIANTSYTLFPSKYGVPTSNPRISNDCYLEFWPSYKSITTLYTCLNKREDDPDSHCVYTDTIDPEQTTGEFGAVHHNLITCVRDFITNGKYTKYDFLVKEDQPNYYGIRLFGTYWSNYNYYGQRTIYGGILSRSSTFCKAYAVTQVFAEGFIYTNLAAWALSDQRTNSYINKNKKNHIRKTLILVR